MDRYEQLLKTWCDSLIRLQIRGYGTPHDGGFLCPACTAIHGRADNAFYPFLYLYQTAGDRKYYEAAESVFHWHDRMINREKAAFNDLNNLWVGTTTFSALGYYKALTKTADAMEPALRSAVEARFSDAAGWVYDHMRLSVIFQTNINYYAASADVLACAGKYFGRENYLAESRKLLDYCMERFSENGLLIGESFPHDEVTAHGCRPVDMGYDLEESIPCLAETAEALGDEALLRKLAGLLLRNIDFLLPDGGLDNSFGTRNNKWTYYGSRTSDGCGAVLMMLGKYEPLLYEAAYRNTDLLASCTSEGLLTGGRDYKKLGLRPCSHHSICHAVALADAIQEGLSETHRASLAEHRLPCDTADTKLVFYPELDTYRISIGSFIATVTNYDYRPYTFDNGAAHASGCTLTMLYHREKGIAVAGSTLEYKQTEPLNMQAPVLELPHEPLIPRIEYRDSNGLFRSCLETDPSVSTSSSDDRIVIIGNGSSFAVKYLFRKNELTVQTFIPDCSEKESPVFILPVIRGSVAVRTRNRFSVREIYWLAGGFAADEYRITPDENGEILVTLS